jgi:hypothetical protein
MFKKLSFLFVILLIVPKLLLAENVTKLFTQGSYDSAFREGYADALSGDPESSYIIGRILVEGKGSAKENINDGIDFIKSSASDDFLKAVVFLAKNYEEGIYTAENRSTALKYYEIAKKLDGSKYSKKVAELRIALFGEVSKKTCVLYDKKNKKNAYKIGQCIAKNFLEGNASSYFLVSFDNGNNNSFLSAAKRMLKVKSNTDLMPLVIRIPDFKRKASKSEINKFKKLINQNGFDSSFCGKAAKKNRFSKPEKSSGNNAGCALAAEKGDSGAATVAYEWWKNGSNGFPRKKKYAESLLKKMETSEDVNIAEILEKYEDQPKIHYEKSMTFIKSRKLNKSIVGKALSLEIELISKKDFDFADDYSDVANVIEYVDWKAVDTEILAKFYKFYMLELKDESDDLNTPRVKNNIKKITYNKSFIKSLGALRDGGELANKFMMTAVFENCEALNYATKYNDDLDISIETIQEAQGLLLNKCDLKVAKKSMKELLKIAKRDIDSVKIFIDQRLNHRLPCQDYSDFLEFNKNNLEDFDADFDSLNNQCLQHSIVAYKLASLEYKNKSYDTSYEYAEQGCNSSKSRGCSILATLLLHKKTTESSQMSNDEIMLAAIDFLKVGHENGDINSTALLHDLVNKSPLFSIHADTNLAKEIFPDLKKSKAISAIIQVKKQCFSLDPIKSLFKNCSSVCSFAKRTNKRKDIDIGAVYALQSIFKKQACL